MKKNILSLIVLLSLCSCSNDLINSTIDSSNTEEPINSVYTVDNNLGPAGIYNYESPYDLNSGNSIPVDFINNSTDVYVELWPIFINGYWDGNANNFILDFNSISFPAGTSLQSTFPNIFNTVGNEYQVALHADPFILNPLMNINFEDLNNSGFSIISSSTATNTFTFTNSLPSITNEEEIWLKELTKLQGVKYYAYDKATNKFLSSGVVLADFYPNASSNAYFTNTSEMPNWVNTGALFNTGSEMFYFPSSYEIMTANYDGYSDIQIIDNYVTGNSYHFSFHSSLNDLKIILQ